MDEKMLFWLSLVCTVIGIGAVFFISETISSGDVGIGEINDGHIGKKVAVTGMIVNVVEKPSLFLLELGDDNGSISVIYFKGGGSFLNKAEYNASDFVLGGEMEAVGNVQEWYGKLEIIAEELSLNNE